MDIRAYWKLDFTREKMTLWAGLAAFVLAVCFGSPAHANKLKVAAVLNSPVDHQWVSRVHVSLLKARDRGEIDYLLAEAVAASDTIRVIREYAEQGAELIVAESYTVEREARDLAKEYPKIKFLLASSLPPDGTNVAVFDNWNQDAAYLGGILAGSITKTNKLGAVGGMAIPEINRLIGAFREGACTVNPKVQMLVSFVGGFYNIPADKEAALAQIESGADVIYAERFGANQAALEKKKYAIANLMVQDKAYDAAVITSTLWNAEPMFDAAIADVKNGKFAAKDYGREYGSYVIGGSALAPLGEWEKKLPPDAVRAVKEAEAKMKAGTLKATIFQNKIDSGPCPK
ncbi:MAG: BMP family protein [Afipia sp.]|nr:BMP family protein [Afipia sp.]